MSARRILDVVVTLLVLPFALVLGALIAIAVYLDSPGPVIYRCRRVGKGGRVFLMPKFRKMRREAAGPSLTSRDDARFTPIGRFLTATRLDELPQLWNVLKGEMRLIGPRPEVEEFVATHPTSYREILTVTPGLTGLSQLEFLHEREELDGDDKHLYYNQQILPRKIELDLRYVREGSLLLDLRILAATFALPLVVPARQFVALGHALGRTRALSWSFVAVTATLLALTFVMQAGSLR